MQNAKAIKIPILTYHSIDESGSVISTKLEVFRRQMEFLNENGYNVVSLGNFLEFSNEENSLPPETVVLTFDDGFQNFYTSAFPVLEKCGFKATVFLVTDYCGKHNDWAGNPAALPPSKILSWNEIKELNDYGIEFGAHTRTHPDLTRIRDAQIESEIAESKSAIENALGSEVKTFAYPFGKFNRSAKQIAEKMFKAACSPNLGKVNRSSDFFSLERVDAYYLSNPKIFNSLSSKTFDRYLRFRQSLRDFKSLISQN